MQTLLRIEKMLIERNVAVWLFLSEEQLKRFCTITIE